MKKDKLSSKSANSRELSLSVLFAREFIIFIIFSLFGLALNFYIMPTLGISQGGLVPSDGVSYAFAAYFVFIIIRLIVFAFRKNEN
ncbi:MAG: hypothetical protein WCV72_03995 [Patescibacteria group bacterium]